MCPITSMNTSKKITSVYKPVSYTHLDVYKRQVQELGSISSDSYGIQGGQCDQHCASSANYYLPF